MDKRLFFLMNMAQHRVFRFADNKSVELLDIPVSQVAAMLYVAKNEGCLQKDLSQALGLNNSAVTGLAKRMEARALIQRQPCNIDGRATRLYLAERGRETLPQVFPLIAQLNELLAADFSDDEIAVVMRFLNKVIETF
ncbi:MAG: MarR family transcriptional regulator [Candidatus Pelagadaptatus aseana]|uniref:MarR family winged helix-turn-helix transcriptional regulator n=1 Tax=Candidatus Pelagadaptatus aseana TaxID=3120508 RepID=UPI0039B337F0